MIFLYIIKKFKFVIINLLKANLKIKIKKSSININFEN